jgi:hypothetical protein
MNDDIGPFIAKDSLQSPALDIQLIQAGSAIDIFPRPGRQVIHDDDLVPLFYEPIDHMRADESCAARYEYLHHSSDN